MDQVRFWVGSILFGSLLWVKHLCSEVKKHWAWLIIGCITSCGIAYHLGQLCFHLLVVSMSSNARWEVKQVLMMFKMKVFRKHGFLYWLLEAVWMSGRLWELHRGWRMSVDRRLCNQQDPLSWTRQLHNNRTLGGRVSSLNIKIIVSIMQKVVLYWEIMFQVS